MAIIGIDLGTTNSLATVWGTGKAQLIPNSFGQVMTPSMVSVLEDGEVVVGKVAKERLISHPQLTASGFKQFMGTAKTWQLGAHTFTPEDLSALVLRQLKADAEEYLGCEVTEAVVSVPAHFNDNQRAATKLAGRLAGLTVDRIINEPSAASLANRRGKGDDGTNIVVDFGGGTLDISVVETFENIVDIIAVAGDNHLGGGDIDTAILNAFLAANPVLANTLDEKERASLLKTAELCKIALTTQPQTYMLYQRGGQSFSMMLDTPRLMEICAPILGRMRETMLRAVRDAALPLAAADGIVLVGGSCRMPLIQQYIQHLAGQPPFTKADPDYAVAIGAGIVSGIKARDEQIRDMVLTDICPFTLGIRTRRGKEGPEVFSPIIPRNSSLPASRVEEYRTLHDGQERVAVEIYQGESLTVENNLFLGTVEMQVPPMPAGHVVVQVRFTYDINGILDVEVTSEQTGESARKVIVNSRAMTTEEVEKRMAVLQQIKTKARQQDEDRLVIAQGERLFEEHSGPMRERISHALTTFMSALDHDVNPARLARMRKGLRRFFDRLDQYDENLMQLPDEDFEDFEAFGEDWEAEDE